MADTANYGWTKPTVNADVDTWGGLVDAAYDDIDSDLKAVANAATAAIAAAVAGVGVNIQTASYTVAITDAGVVVEIFSASANNFTVPPNSSVAFPVGAVLNLTQIGAGQTTIVAGAGVTLRSFGGALKLLGQYAGASLYQRAANDWVVQGALST